jgi:hypothetical protein
MCFVPVCRLRTGRAAQDALDEVGEGVTRRWGMRRGERNHRYAVRGRAVRGVRVCMRESLDEL